MALAEQAHRAAARLQDHEYARVVCHGDGDGLAAAGLLCRALQREGIDFHASAERELTTDVLERLAAEGQPCLVLLDLAPHGLDIAEAASDVVVIDHHARDGNAPDPEGAAEVGLHHVDAAHHRSDGSREASSATVAHTVALALSRENHDLFPLALAGAVADRQHLGGLKGLNAELAAEARDAGVPMAVGLLPHPGEGLRDALAASVDPYLRGLSGRARAVQKVLEGLGLDPETPVGDVAEDDARRVASALALHLVDQGARASAVDALVGPRAPVPVPGVPHAHALAALLSAATPGERPGLALALLLGDDAAAGELHDLADAHAPRLLQALLRLEREGLTPHGTLRSFEAADARLLPQLAGLVQTYLAGRHVVVGHAPDGDALLLEGRTGPGGRGGHPDLRARFRAARSELGLDPDHLGPVAGHAAAARVRLPPDAAPAFLEALDRHLEGNR